MSEPIDMYFNDFIKLNRGFDLPESKITAGKYPIAASTAIKDYHNAFKVKAPCVTTGRSGSLGTVLYINENCWPLNTSLYVKDYKGSFPKYVYYFLQTMKLESFNCGAGVPTLNQNHLHKIKIRVHKKEEQPEIASILSNYDELIENNNRRIAILEQTAEQIYKEWFVCMRFPGYENTEFEKGVPKGWKWKKLKQIVNTQYGYTASADMEIEGPKFLRITDIANSYIDWSNVPNCLINENEIEKYKLRFGDIVVARTGATAGYAKRIHKNHPSSVFASYLVRIKLKDVRLSFYIGLIVESNTYKDFIMSIAGGAAQPQANANVLTEMSVFVPDIEIIQNFNTIVEPIFDQIETLRNQNQNLKRTRDLLLPRLISGKLKVSER